MMATSNEVISEERGAPRRIVEAASTVRAEGRGPIDVMVRDLSETGIRILTPAILEIGQEISIGLSGAGLTRAFVVWRRDEHYGCVFEAPIGAESAAQAFSTPSVVRLGQTADPLATRGEADLREMFRQHRFWQLPLDAALATLLVLCFVAYLLYLLVRA
jgi:hypothetical protein